jgi:hypothetical protein
MTIVSGANTSNATASKGERFGVVLVWGAAIFVAALGATIAFEAAAGINWGIWTTLAGGGLLWLARRRARLAASQGVAPARTDPVAVWGVVLASVVAWGGAVTANGLFQFFIVVSCVVLLAVATRVVSGVEGRQVGGAVMARAPFNALGATVIEAGRRSVSVVTGIRGERYAAPVRGIILAAPVAALFALILAGADPTLAGWRNAMWDALRQLHFVPRLLFFLGLGTIVLGAYGLALCPPVTGRAERPIVSRIGPTERRLIVGAVGAVFGAFLLLQPVYLFLDTNALKVSGMTYAEYAHRGFMELTIAATLAAGLVVALDRYGGSAGATGRKRGGGGGGGGGRFGQWGTLLLIGEVLVLLASAFHRLTIYESAYGYTALRLYVQAYIVGVALTLLILAAELVNKDGGFDARRAARRTVVMAMAFLVALSFANPEGLVVARNMERFRAAGVIDGEYLARMSLNAVPAVTAALAELPPLCAARMRWDMGWTYRPDLARSGRDRWYEWNFRRARGLAALRAAGITSDTSTVYPDSLKVGCPEKRPNYPIARP